MSTLFLIYRVWSGYEGPKLPNNIDAYCYHDWKWFIYEEKRKSAHTAKIDDTIYFLFFYQLILTCLCDSTIYSATVSTRILNTKRSTRIRTHDVIKSGNFSVLYSTVWIYWKHLLLYIEYTNSLKNLPF